MRFGFTGTKVQILTPAFLQGLQDGVRFGFKKLTPAFLQGLQEGVRFAVFLLRRVEVYWLYWYKSTNTDT